MERRRQLKFMARTPFSLLEVFCDLAMALDFDVDTEANQGGLEDADARLLLRHLNKAHVEARTFAEWEDAWQSGELTPVSGVIGWADVDEARQFTLFSEDPRPEGSCARVVPFATDQDGIHLKCDESPVFGFWIPKVEKFTLADLTTESDAEILAVLAPGLVEIAAGEYLLAKGAVAAAKIRLAAGKDLLDEAAGLEFPRVQTRWWLRRTN